MRRCPVGYVTIPENNFRDFPSAPEWRKGVRTIIISVVIYPIRIPKTNIKLSIQSPLPHLQRPPGREYISLNSKYQRTYLASHMRTPRKNNISLPIPSPTTNIQRPPKLDIKTPTSPSQIASPQSIFLLSPSLPGSSLQKNPSIHPPSPTCSPHSPPPHPFKKVTKPTNSPPVV